MTIEEAKKIIEMSTDIIESKDKLYVNKDFIFKIMDMITLPPNVTCPRDNINFPINEPAVSPNWPPTWPQVWYKDDLGKKKKKVPWWVWYKSPYDFTCNGGSTGSKPDDPTTVDMSIKRTDYIDDFKPSVN